MADRIERYLGRLEAELDGRVDEARLEEILVEVEGHLRESEEAYRELGEPEELANRFAIEEFGSDVDSVGVFLPTQRKAKALLPVVGFGILFLGFIFSTMLASKAFWIWAGCFAVGALILGTFFGKQWKLALAGNFLVLALGALTVSALYGGTFNTYGNLAVLQRMESSEAKWLVDGAPWARKLDELAKAQGVLNSAVPGSQEAASAQHWVQKLEIGIAATREIQTSSYVDRLKFTGAYALLYGGAVSFGVWLFFGIGVLIRFVGMRMTGSGRRRFVNG